MIKPSGSLKSHLHRDGGGEHELGHWVILVTDRSCGMGKWYRMPFYKMNVAYNDHIVSCTVLILECHERHDQRVREVVP